jgi:xanthine dehydrogenase large subunit
MTVNLSVSDGQAPKEAVGQPTVHESAQAQVMGEARYIDDIPELKNTCHAAPILSLRL